MLIRKRKYYLQNNHKKTKRNYLKRINDSKVDCIKIAKKYGYDYWDGLRKYGYGGHYYIKDYWKSFAIKLIKAYKLSNNSKVIDLGCGKGFLIYELKKILPDLSIVGVDLSKYAIKNAKKEIKENLIRLDLRSKIPFKTKEFDLAISLATFHNFDLSELEVAVNEMNRIAKKKYLMVESFKSDKQRHNLQCWALTAETLISIKDWQWLFKKLSFNGEYEFILFD